MRSFHRGVRDGLPIGLGYFSVSIGFGLLAVSGGLTLLQAVLISMCNLTSAGQMAGVNVMFAGGTLVEMAVSQGVINLRYALMSLSLSQKLDDSMTLPHRLAWSFFNTDEIFAVASGQTGSVGRSYLYALAVLPYLGWALGTLTGAAAGMVLPGPLRDGLGIAIYGMFLAIIVPPARAQRPIRLAVLLAIALRCALYYLPGLREISGGFAVVLSAVAVCTLCALKYPIREADT